MNYAFSALLNEKIELFKHSFGVAARQSFVDPATGKLFHAGEFGTYRERILKDFLKLAVPGNLEMGSGFLINAAGGVSTQADIVVFDRSVLPRIESAERQRFFPVEGVCGIGEVKSRLTKSDLRQAMNKLARVKATADHVSSTIAVRRDPAITQLAFSRENLAYDQMFSFIVCEGFDFDPSSLSNEIANWYEPDIKAQHKHNMVLSVENGLLLYFDNSKKSWFYPPTTNHPAKNRFVRVGKGENTHFYLFSNYINIALSSATILYPEMTAYMPSMDGGSRLDEI